MPEVPRREERRLQELKRKKNGKTFKKEGPKFRRGMMRQLCIARDLEEDYEQQAY